MTYARDWFAIEEAIKLVFFHEVFEVEYRSPLHDRAQQAEGCKHRSRANSAVLGSNRNQVPEGTKKITQVISYTSQGKQLSWFTE